MQFRLSPSAQRLLIRGFFVVIALGSWYGVYDNREFFLRFPFYLIAVIDIAFGLILLYFAVLLRSLLQTHRTTVLLGTAAMGLYTIGAGIVGSIFFLRAVGLERAVELSDYSSTSLYVTSELLYALVLPAIVFGVILWMLRGERIIL